MLDMRNSRLNDMLPWRSKARRLLALWKAAIAEVETVPSIRTAVPRSHRILIPWLLVTVACRLPCGCIKGSDAINLDAALLITLLTKEAIKQVLRLVYESCS